jgi:hypothetical protein
MPGYGFYARDQWQVTRKLTINFGARFERYPFATRDHRGGERYDADANIVLIGGLGGVPEDTGVKVPRLQVAPRLGIAYRVNEKTVIRAATASPLIRIPFAACAIPIPPPFLPSSAAPPLSWLRVPCEPESPKLSVPI